MRKVGKLSRLLKYDKHIIRVKWMVSALVTNIPFMANLKKGASY